MAAQPLLIGCDFSSAPTARKQIVIATGALEGARVRLASLLHFPSLQAWSDWLEATPRWTGAFDFPFGLPRELVEQLGWPTDWRELMTHYAGLTRGEIRRTFADFCAARPVGGKFAHRATDRPAGSSPSMKWINPPVAFMLHAGVTPLLQAHASFPGLHTGQGERIALEGYPGLLARELIGRRSYKSDDRARQNEQRSEARRDLLSALEAGMTRLGLALQLDDESRTLLAQDANGDRMDAVLCLMQAAWAHQRAESPGPGHGLPEDIDPLEGWIVTA